MTFLSFSTPFLFSCHAFLVFVTLFSWFGCSLFQCLDVFDGGESEESDSLGCFSLLQVLC